MPISDAAIAVKRAGCFATKSKKRVAQSCPMDFRTIPAECSPVLCSKQQLFLQAWIQLMASGLDARVNGFWQRCSNQANIFVRLRKVARDAGASSCTPASCAVAGRSLLVQQRAPATTITQRLAYPRICRPSQTHFFWLLLAQAIAVLPWPAATGT